MTAALLTFAAALALAAGGWLAYFQRLQRASVLARLCRLLDLPPPPANPLQAWRSRFNDGSEYARQMAAQLARAGLSLSPFDWHLLHLGVVLLLTLLMHRAFRLNWSWSLAVAAILVPAGFQLLLRVRRGSLSQAVNRQLPEAVRVLSNSLHAGLSIPQGLARVGQEVPGPVGPLIRRAVREMQLGTTLAEALEAMRERVASLDLQFVVTTVLLQHEVGGDLAGALEQIAATLAERSAVEGEIQTATAEQRYVAMILPVVPLAGILLLNLGHPGYVEVLLKPLGLLLLLISLLLQVTGFVLIHRTARIKV